MKGSYEIVVRNRRVQYKFTVRRSVTVLCGDSATGKTTLIGTIADYQRTGEQSGITLQSEKRCAVLGGPSCGRYTEAGTGSFARNRREEWSEK